MTRLASRELGALTALTAILVITAIWWALALWPLPTDVPAWLVRTRAVCFGSVRNELPSTAGWMVLLGQPIYMLAALWLISGQTLMAGLRGLAGFPAGRGVLTGAALCLVVGLGAAGVRVGWARSVDTPLEAGIPAGTQRLDRVAPALALLNDDSGTTDLAAFRGRPVLLTFAFGHCATVCPLIVHDLLAVQSDLGEQRPVLLVVTLDPWRDVPSRLPAIARQWGFGPDAQLLGGSVADVERALDAWEVGRERDVRTGDVTHAPLVYLIDRRGRIAYALTGAEGRATITALVREL